MKSDVLADGGVMVLSARVSNPFFNTFNTALARLPQSAHAGVAGGFGARDSLARISTDGAALPGDSNDSCFTTVWYLTEDISTLWQ